MTKAFVFGKFLPYHKGHEAMIRFAQNHCDFLTVLICCSDKEKIAPALREEWIRESIGDHPGIKIQLYHYLESDLPNTSVASHEVSQIWSKVFKALFPDYSLLVTSEPYGEFVAGFMDIKHILFDQERKLFPVSATAIRNEVVKHWEFLPDHIKPYFTTKIIVLGTESTGKTTLTKRIAAYFKAPNVLEAARDIIKDSKNFSFDDLYKVAEEHSKRIEKACMEKKPLMIIDTDIHTTISYATFLFHKELPLENNSYIFSPTTLWLYLDKEAPYLQDGTRLNKQERDLLDLSHREILNIHTITYKEISGDWEDRFQKSVAYIEDFMKQQITFRE